jgi:hypothetical protein
MPTVLDRCVQELGKVPGLNDSYWNWYDAWGCNRHAAKLQVGFALHELGLSTLLMYPQWHARMMAGSHKPQPAMGKDLVGYWHPDHCAKLANHLSEEGVEVLIAMARCAADEGSLRHPVEEGCEQATRLFGSASKPADDHPSWALVASRWADVRGTVLIGRQRQKDALALRRREEAYRRSEEGRLAAELDELLELNDERGTW